MTFRAAGLAAAMLILGACDIVVGSLNSQATDEWKRSYTLAPGGQVEVVNVNGTVEVQPSDGSTVEVRAEKRARGASEAAAREVLQRIEIREDAAPDRIRLETKLPSGLGLFSQGEVHYWLTVPRTANVRLHTTNGNLKVAGVEGRTRLETTNGAVSAERLGGAVEASTTNGSIHVDVDGVKQDGIRLETTNGAIRLTVPATVKADIVARCVNGSIDASSLNLERSGESSRRRLEGRLNGGGPRVELETTNGSIKITGK